MCVVALGAAYLFFKPGRNSDDHEAHYAALEKHREEQRHQANAETPAATSSADQPAVTNATDQAAAPNSSEQQPASSNDATALSHAGEVTKATRNYWTDFRGPGRDGRYDELMVKTNWPTGGLPLLWRQPVGGGYASFVIAEGRAFTIEQRRRQEVVAAYDVETGRELWAHGWQAEFKESMGGDGPRATPTWNAGRLYALGATGEFRCLEAKTGKVIWSRNILSDNRAGNLQWGMSAAPLIVDDKVIVLPGGALDNSVVAYNKLTGAPVWKALSDQASYTSPMLVTLAGRRQILVVTARRAVGLAPEDGSLLWETPWENQAGINVSQPIIVDQNRFFISAGYGKGAALVEVTGTGKSFTARKVWEHNSMKNKFNSSVLHDGHIYGLDEGILTCIDVGTGARKWKGGRYGYGQVLLLASGHLLITTEDGEIVLVKATPEQHTELAKFSALEGRTWNNAAIANGRLLVRNTTEMACYNLLAQ
ncbi:MAG TPA: PQQ-binding-like beta-propeller repeat protein [Pyrinomonadaceae bacterium]|nr:PQQ-binding-like beta-propeller repeat protein [Pyrinomonadaceae bacterium]